MKWIGIATAVAVRVFIGNSGAHAAIAKITASRVAKAQQEASDAIRGPRVT